MQKSSGHVTKFMPRFDGPYTVIEVHPDTSTYTLDLPNSPNIFPTFHASQLHQYTPNDPNLFPNCELPGPSPIVTNKGQLENFIDKIINKKNIGCRKKYLVQWVGFGAENDEWISCQGLKDCEALDVWERGKVS